MTYVCPKNRFYSVPTWWKPLYFFPFWDDVFMHKAKDLKFPFDQIHETTQATLRPYLGESVEQKKGVTEIYT